MEHYQPVLHGTNGTVPLLETDPPRLHYLWIATNAEVLTEYATKSRQREQAAESLRQTIQSRRDHPDEPFDHAHDERERRLLAAEQDIAVDYGKLLVHLVQKAGECLLKPQYAVLQPTGWTVGKPFPNSEAFIAELQRLHQEANDRFHELSRQLVDPPSANVEPVAGDDWIKVSDAAKKHGLDAGTISKACTSGDIRCVGQGAKRRIDPQSMKRFADRYGAKQRDQQAWSATSPTDVPTGKPVISSGLCHGCGTTVTLRDGAGKCPKCHSTHIDPIKPLRNVAQRCATPRRKS